MNNKNIEKRILFYLKISHGAIKSKDLQILVGCSGRMLRTHILNIIDEQYKKALKGGNAHIIGASREGYFICKNEDDINKAFNFIRKKAISSLEKLQKLKKTVRITSPSHQYQLFK